MDWQKRNQHAIERGLSTIKNIPFTRAVLLTGSLAEGHATEKSDIDFFVQVEEGRIWTACLLVRLFLQVTGMKRTDSTIAGRICLNWFATYDAPAEQNGRVSNVLWQETQPSKIKSFLENLASGFLGNTIENITKKYQIYRIEDDPRTREKGSQVRYSDREIGFHPIKKPR